MREYGFDWGSGNTCEPGGKKSPGQDERRGGKELGGAKEGSYNWDLLYKKHTIFNKRGVGRILKVNSP